MKSEIRRKYYAALAEGKSVVEATKIANGGNAKPAKPAKKGE